MRWVAAVVVATGCTSTGALELQLELPSDPALRPTGMTSITVITTAPGREPIENTSAFGETFSAGALPTGEDIRVEVELRDAANRLVGVGEAIDAFDVAGDATTTLVIPVRRPFVYAASGSALYSYDPTLDAENPQFQSRVTGVSSPRVVVSLGADRLVVSGDQELHVIATATNTVTFSILVPAGGRDVASLPGERSVALAHDNGISIIDVDLGTITEVPVGRAVDQVVASTDSNGRVIVYGLIGRVAPATSAIGTCTGSSQLVTVAADDPGTVKTRTLARATSAIAAAPGRLFAAEPCTGRVNEIVGDPLGGAPPLDSERAQLAGVAALAVQGDRLIAVGTQPSVPVCGAGNAPCPPTASDACPTTSTTRVSFVNEGARISLLTIPLTGGGPPTSVILPEQREAVASRDDQSEQLTQNLRPLGTVPIDLVSLRGDNSVAVVVQSSYYIDALANASGQDIFPCIKASTNSWMIVDLARAAVVNRVRSQCTLATGGNALFGNWICGKLPDAETSTVGAYAPISVGALLGGR